MQIAAEVKRVLNKEPSKILTEHFKLTFSRKRSGESKKEVDIEKITAESKSMWGSFLNLFKNNSDGS